MKLEFEQLLKGLGILFYQDGTLETRYLDKLLFQELMENTWNLAIEESAKTGYSYGEGMVTENAILKLKI